MSVKGYSELPFWGQLGPSGKASTKKEARPEGAGRSFGYGRMCEATAALWRRLRRAGAGVSTAATASALPVTKGKSSQVAEPAEPAR
jgi:hypothetical protein